MFVFGLLLAMLTAGGGDAARRDASSCPALRSGWLSPAEGVPDHRVLLDVRMRGPDIVRGNRVVSRRTLRTYLSRSRTMAPAPFIAFDPKGAADCAVATAVRDLIHEAARCGEAVFCGQGGRGEWMRDIR